MIRTITTLLLAALVLFNSGCTKRDPFNSNLKTLTVHIPSEVTGFDPGGTNQAQALEILSLIHETLYQFDYLSEDHHPVPLLALDFPKLSSDSKTVTIRLRSDAAYAPDPAFGGKKRGLKAQDFIFAWKRLALPSVSPADMELFIHQVVGLEEFRSLIKSAKYDEIKGLLSKPVEGLQAPDDFTIVIQLKNPIPSLTRLLSLPTSAPLASEIFNLHADELMLLHSHPVGTGPFFLADWKRGTRTLLQKNPNFHPEFYPTHASPRLDQAGYLADGGKLLPFVEQIHFKIEEDPIKAWKNFEQGEFDVIQKFRSLSKELAKKGVVEVSDPHSQVFYLMFNLNDPVLGGSRELRQAISSAIHGEGLFDVFTQDRIDLATQTLPLTVAERTSIPRRKFDYNLERAKELLKKAGFPEGQGLKPIQLEMRSSDRLMRELGDLLVRQLADVGITLHVRYSLGSGFESKLRNQGFQVAFDGWAMDYPQAQNLYQLLRGKNHSNLCAFDSGAFNSLYDELTQTSDPAKRSAIVAKMEDILQNELPWIPLYYPRTSRYLQSRVSNYRPDSMMFNKLKYVRVK